MLKLYSWRYWICEGKKKPQYCKHLTLEQENAYLATGLVFLAYITSSSGSIQALPFGSVIYNAPNYTDRLFEVFYKSILRF